MRSLGDDETRGVLGEVLSDQLAAILEYVKDIPHIKRRVDTLGEDMREVKSDIKVMKAVLTGTNRDLKDHEKRITRLEAFHPGQS